MKKINAILGLILSGLLILPVPHSLAATGDSAEGSLEGKTYANTDFEDIAVGTYPKATPIVNTGLTCNQTESEVKTEQTDLGENRYISASCAIQQGWIVNSLTNVAMDNYVVEFDIRVTSADCAFQLVIRSGSGSKFDLKPITLEKGGQININGQKSTYTFGMGDWHKIAVLCKCESSADGLKKDYTVFIDGENAGTFADTKTDNTIATVTQTGFWVSSIPSSGTAGTVDFDNICVYTEKYGYGAKYLRAEDADILANEVSLNTNLYDVDTDEQTISIARGLSRLEFLDSIRVAYKGKLVSLTDVSGVETETITDGSILTLSSYNNINTLTFTFHVVNLAPTVKIAMPDLIEMDDFSSIRFTAEDDDAIDYIDVLIGDTYLDCVQGNETGDYELPFTPEYCGAYSIKVIAYDKDGKSATDTAELFAVKNNYTVTTSLDFESGVSKLPFYQSAGFGTAGTYYEALQIDSAHGKSFVATETVSAAAGSGGPWVGVSYEDSQKAKLQYDLYLAEEGVSTTVFVRDMATSPSVVNQMPQVSRGVLNYYDGSTKKTVELESRRWYTIETLIDCQKDCYDFSLYCEGELINEFKNLALTKHMNTMTDLRICFGGGADGKVAIDNVILTVIQNMPYIAGVSTDEQQMQPSIDYKAASVYVNIPTGFTLPTDLSVVSLSCDEGNVKIKELSKSEDGKWLIITPDYLPTQGFEPSTAYDLTLGEAFLCNDGKTEVGYKNISGFTTTQSAFDVKKAVFSKTNGVKLHIDFANEAADEQEVLVVMAAYQNGIFVKSSCTKVILSGTNPFVDAVCSNLSAGTIVKAHILTPANRSMNNKIYEYKLS